MPDGKRTEHIGATELRRRAESSLMPRMRVADDDELAATIHELRVHQVELEMQNDELRRNQAELAAAHDAYRELYDAAPVGYVTLDPRGVIIEANRTAATMLGVDKMRLRGIPLAAFLARPAADALHRHLIDVFDHLTPLCCELALETRGSDARHVRLDSVAAHRECRTTITDVSARVALENKLREVNAGLEARVEQRTAERERLQEQLVNARRLESIGRLAGGVAHDFNNLLTVFDLEIALLRPEVADRKEATACLDELARASDLATSLTSKLLSFARREVIHAEPLDPAIAITAFEPVLARLAGDHVRLRLDIVPGAGWVEIDPSGLEQVLLNLVVNARDAIDGTGTIDVRVARSTRDGSGDYVAISVRDTGCGMDADTIAQLFEPFFTTKGVGRGTGLGMATVHGTVTQAGGVVDVHSTVGQGTEIVVYLPSVAPVRPSARARALAPLRGGGETILLVDDDAGVRGAIAMTLEYAGYRVIAADGGVAALAALERDPAGIDLLLSDVVMPGMSGPVLASKVRQVDARMPIVLMSGFLFDETVEPDTLFIQKPFRPEAALRMIREALDAQRSAARIDT